MGVCALIKGRITVREPIRPNLQRLLSRCSSSRETQTNSQVASVLWTKSSRVHFHVQTSELLKCCCCKVAKQLWSRLLRGADRVQNREIKSLIPKLRRHESNMAASLQWPSESPPPVITDSQRCDKITRVIFCLQAGRRTSLTNYTTLLLFFSV